MKTKKTAFLPSKDNNSNKESSHNFNPMQAFVGLIKMIISVIEIIWLKLTVLEMYEGKNLTDPFVLYLVTADMYFDESYIRSMQKTLKNIQTKFGSNWSLNV